MVEQALMQSLAAPDKPVPASMVHWVVTVAWPRPSLRFDVCYPRREWSRPLDI